MKLLKNTILASVLTALLPIASFAQTTAQSAGNSADIASYWAQNNEEELRSEFENISLSWGGYVLSLGHEADEATSYSALFHAFTADFARVYGVQPQQASISQLRDYYAKRKNNYGGELLLPTMAVWKNRPMLSIIPLPDNLDAYWGNPDQAGDTYDFMASIDREDTLYFMGSYLGSFYGHPTKQKDLKNFWKKWMKRSDNSAAKQDIVSLKRAMLAEILSHDPEYAVYELASKEIDLWPQLYVSPVTVEEQSLVQGILSSTCLEDDPTEDCARFVNYANRYKYTENITTEVKKQLSVIYYDGNWGGIYDELYFDSWLYHRRWRVRAALAWYYDIWHPYYWWTGRYYYPYDYRWHSYPWYWGRPPIVVVRPGTHHPPVNHGHRPPVVRPGGHGGNGGHGGSSAHDGHGGHNRPGAHPGTNRNGGPGSRHNGGAGGRRPGGNGGGGNRGNNPGGDNGNHGHTPGGHSGNGDVNGGNGSHGNGGAHGGNGGHNPNNGGTVGNNRPRPSDIKVDKKPTNVEKRPNTNVTPGSRTNHGSTGGSTTVRPSGNNGSTGGSVRPGRDSGTMGGSTTRPTVINHGNIERNTNTRTTTPSTNRSVGSSSGSSSRPSTVTTPSRSNSSVGNSGRSSGSYSTPSRSSSGGSFGGSRSSGSYSTPSRSSSGGSFGGSSHSSGGSHGSSSSGSHGSSHGGRR